MSNPYVLAASLAKPVARGYLSRTEADTAVLLAVDDVGAYRVARHILSERLRYLEGRRAMTWSRIRQRIRPLIAQRKPRNALLAEAHDVNGAHGFPFAEPEVTDIVLTAVYWATPQGARRHG